jgi:hypothetical protein
MKTIVKHDGGFEVTFDCRITESDKLVVQYMKGFGYRVHCTNKYVLLSRDEERTLASIFDGSFGKELSRRARVETVGIGSEVLRGDKPCSVFKDVDGGLLLVDMEVSEVVYAVEDLEELHELLLSPTSNYSLAGWG